MIYLTLLPVLFLTKQTDIPETLEIEMLLKGLDSNIDLSTFETGFHSEKLAFLEVTKVLQLFCQEVTVNAMNYRKVDIQDCSSTSQFETWRGSPDGQIRGIVMNMIMMYLYCQFNNPGTSTACEAKLKFAKGDYPQLVKTAVVASFIEANLHPNLNTMVPTISRLTVVSRAVKESRTHATTVSYLHKRITLIERSPKTSSKTYPLKKSARTTKITLSN